MESSSRSLDQKQAALDHVIKRLKGLKLELDSIGQSITYPKMTPTIALHRAMQPFTTSGLAKDLHVEVRNGEEYVIPQTESGICRFPTRAQKAYIA